MKLAERVYTARDVRRMTGWNPSRSYQFMKRHGWQIGGKDTALFIYHSKLQEILSTCRKEAKR